MHKNSLPSLIAVIVHAVGFAFYLYILYNVIPDDNQLYVKGCMYCFMALMHLYLVIDEWDGIDNYKQLQFNTINKSLFISNFIMIGLTIFKVLDGVLPMYCYLGAISLTSIFILKSGLQHNYFDES